MSEHTPLEQRLIDRTGTLTGQVNTLLIESETLKAEVAILERADRRADDQINSMNNAYADMTEERDALQEEKRYLLLAYANECESNSRPDYAEMLRDREKTELPSRPNDV